MSPVSVYLGHEGLRVLTRPLITRNLLQELGHGKSHTRDSCKSCSSPRRTALIQQVQSTTYMGGEIANEHTQNRVRHEGRLGFWRRRWREVRSTTLGRETQFALVMPLFLIPMKRNPAAPGLIGCTLKPIYSRVNLARRLFPTI